MPTPQFDSTLRRNKGQTDSAPTNQKEKKSRYTQKHLCSMATPVSSKTKIIICCQERGLQTAK